MTGFQYTAFGLNIDSEIELPELLPHSSTRVDVFIKIGPVPTHLPKITKSGVLFESYEGDLLLKLKTVGRYRVRNGNQITISPNKEASHQEIRLFLLGSAMGAIILQRGLLPLHGSAICKNGNGVVFTGESASGKSSLAAIMNIKGYSFIADDISVLIPNDKGDYFIQPGIQHVKLWKDVISLIGQNHEMKKIRTGIEKYLFPIIENKNTSPSMVNYIITLSTKESSGMSYKKLKGVDSFHSLVKNTYRSQFIDGLGLSESHFHNISKLANSTNHFLIERPSYPLLLKELAEYIESDLLQWH